METIQVVMDTKLLKAADQAAKRRKLNRSALIRDTLREHLKRLHIAELEEREKHAYQVHPLQEDEIRLWENVVAWPED